VANRINGTESLTRKGFNCLLQQNLPKADVVAPGPLERRHRSKSLPLAVNEDAYEHRCEGEDDQKAAEYHSEPNTR
jgi:hypothetical protein